MNISSMRTAWASHIINENGLAHTTSPNMEAHMSPALNGSSVIWCFKHSNAMEIQPLISIHATATCIVFTSVNQILGGDIKLQDVNSLHPKIQIKGFTYYITLI